MHSMLKSHILETLSYMPLQKFYQFEHYKDYRKDYQFRKDTFCLWVLKSIIDNEKVSSILADSSTHIIKLMEMLKKLKAENNVEGISYLVPIVANLKTLLPKAWNHVLKRRPEIESKFGEYTDFLLSHRLKVDYLGDNGTIWGETIFMMAEKMVKHCSHKKGIDLDEHKKFYDEFAYHLIFYRQRAK